MVAPNIGGETSVYGRLRRKQPGRRTRRDFWGKGGLQLRERSTPASKQRVSHMLGAMEGVADSRSPRGDIYQAGEERQMVKVGGEKKMAEEVDSRIWNQIWWVAEAGRN